jgi:hypothetical protein
LATRSKQPFSIERTPEYAEGKKAQRRVYEVFEDAGRLGRWADDARAAWDFQVTNHKTQMVSMEVKSEDRKHKTGNLFIECFQGFPRHESGILITQAQVQVHTLGPEGVAAFRSLHVQKWAQHQIKHEAKPTKAGDNHNMGFLLNRKYAAWKLSGAYWEGPLEQLIDASVMDEEKCRGTFPDAEPRPADGHWPDPHQLKLF